MPARPDGLVTQAKKRQSAVRKSESQYRSARQAFYRSVCDLYENGMRKTEIAYHLGLSEVRIRQILSTNPHG